MSIIHIPVLLKESIAGLNIKPGGTYVDATYGGGGHSAEILKKIGRGRLFAFDQDEEAARDLPESKTFFFIPGNFRFLKNYLRYYKVEKIDGLLADLGVSSHHFDAPERGFTYRTGSVLDMRMNRKSKLTAGMVVNDYEPDQLISVFRNYGELPQAKKLTEAILHRRSTGRITTNDQLIGCFTPLIPKYKENQFLSQVFQALRIEVNQEIESLKELLVSAKELLNPGGRLAVISYHSLEDRLVKNFMKWGSTEGPPQKDLYGRWDEPFLLITKKPVVATDGEILKNPRSRSARLRIAEKN